MCTVSRRMAQILIVSRKSHHSPSRFSRLAPRLILLALHGRSYPHSSLFLPFPHEIELKWILRVDIALALTTVALEWKDVNR